MSMPADRLASNSLGRAADLAPAGTRAGGSTARMRGAAAWACAVAISSVPVLSSQPGFSVIPQILAAGAFGLSLLCLAHGFPRIHVAFWAYAVLVASWSITLLSHPEVWESYFTVLKVLLLGFAAHVVFRSTGQLLLLFGIYAATGIVSVALNLEDLVQLSGTLSDLSANADQNRFAGTFANANTAGVYGVTLLISAVLFSVNWGHWWRWLVFATGGVSGLSLAFLSGSRKAMLGLLLFAFMVPWVLPRSRGRTGMWWATLGMALALAGIALFALSQFPFFERLVEPLTEGLASDSSTEHRAAMLMSAFEIWTAHPLFGCGFEGFGRLSEFGVYSHSTFAEVLCISGVVGFALLLVFYLVPGLQLIRTVRVESAEAPIAGALFCFWATFLLFSFFAIVYDSRESIPMYTAICGWLSSRATNAPAPGSAVGAGQP